MARNGTLGHVGTTIDTDSMQFPINEAGLYAAAHFAGARGLRYYLDHVAANGWRSEDGIIPYDRTLMGPTEHGTPEEESAAAEKWRKEIDGRLTTFVSHTSPRRGAR